MSSDVSGGVINAEGVLTLDSGAENRKLMVRGEKGQPARQCTLPAGLDSSKKVVFISAIACRAVSTGEHK